MKYNIWKFLNKYHDLYLKFFDQDLKWKSHTDAFNRGLDAGLQKWASLEYADLGAWNH